MLSLSTVLNSMKNRERLKHLLIAIFCPPTLVTFFAVSLLPTPPGGLLVSMTLSLTIFGFSLLGPISYPFMFSQPFVFNGPNIVLSLAVVASIILFVIWLLKPSIKLALYVSTSVWVIVGGFITFFGIAAGI